MVMPNFRKGYFSWWGGGVLQYANRPDLRVEDLTRELAVFGTNLDDLLTVLKQHVAPERILLVTHPHKHHLIPEADGRFWRDLVGPAVAEAAARHGVAHYDVTNDLRQAFAGRVADFYWPEDMHFDSMGWRCTGIACGRLRALTADDPVP